MKFKKGNNLGKGRPKGSINQDSEFKKAIKEGIDVNDILAKIATFKRPEDQVDRLIRLLEFAHPKMKSVEVSGDLDVNQDITISRRVIK